jgi:N-acyl-D-amino-acid deacylase
MVFDTLIKGGRLFDGTGNMWRYADVGIIGDHIAAIIPAQTHLVQAREIIDARGKVVTPGFIDVHSHADFSLLDDPFSPYFVFQGITTLIAGNCGHSVVGGGADLVRDYWNRQGLLSFRQLEDKRQWSSLAEYRDLVKNQGGLAFWAGMLMGHGTIRFAIVGPENLPADKIQISKMCEVVRQGMEDGALGLSTGLDYQPGRFAPTSEIIELAKVVAEYGGTYATHIRNTPDRKDAIAAVQEAISIAEHTGVRVQISHLSGKYLQGKEMELIEEARSRGIDVACDAIPYSTFFALSSTHLLLSIRAASTLFMKSLEEVRQILKDPNERKRILMEPKVFRHLQPEKSVFIHCKDKSLEGKTLGDIARQRENSPEDVLIDLMLDEDKPFVLCPKFEHSEDLNAIPEVQIKHPYILMGSDAGPVDPLDPLGWFSPQGSGSTFRYLTLCKKFGVSLEDAVRKLTSLPCQRFGLEDRGILAKGKLADVLVFDPSMLTEMVDRVQPYAPPYGMSYIFVNGQKVVDEGVQTTARPAGILKRGVVSF